MKILCTGGAGYVGSACLRWLLNHGHDPIAFDNLSMGNAKAVPEGRLVTGDILDREALVAVMQIHQIEAVMHFAALASVPDSIADPQAYWRVNVLGTKNVLDAMAECGVQKIVFSSTAATYAFSDQMPLTEESRQWPQVPYGSTKLAAEWMISEYAKAYGLGYTHFRYFNASGADPDGQFGESRPCESHLIPLTLYVALGRRQKLFVFGNQYNTRDGSCVRDYVHTDDIALAHQLAVETLQPGVARSYNIGSGAGSSVFEIHSVCEEVTGLRIPYEIAMPRLGDPATLIASPEKLIRELGWIPQQSEIRAIVESAWRWHQSHPSGYS